jgi:predicted nucleic acid-binding Zn ribbon protein
MFGMRCDDCGEVRWSIFGRVEDADRECPACGAQMREERRHPGSRRLKAGGERREVPAFPGRLKVS